jgi:hypothetical protein
MSRDDANSGKRDDTISEKKANEETELLAILHRHLTDDGIRCLIIRTLQLVIGTETIPPRRAYTPTEMVVYGPDGRGRAKVTIRTRLWGTAFLITPTTDAPEFQFPVGQVSEALHWLKLLARDELRLTSPP